ncbi:nodulation protein NfeD [Halobacillus sp. MO56]
MRRIARYFILMVLLVALLPIIGMTGHEINAEDGKGKLVYIIPVENTVERGMEAFLKRAITEAKEAEADHVIFEIATPGGRVDSANAIGELFQDLKIPNTAFVTTQALSAGSYIALNSDQIYMKPSATMGASGVITSDGKAADKKAQSAWIAAMTAAAESNGRDPIYAEAMADPSVDLPEYNAPEGEFLTLGPRAAVEVGYAKDVVSHRTELLSELGLSKAEIVETKPSLAENIASFLTNPVVVPILLSVASLGLIVELYSPGFGIPGTMGLLSLVLFFYGHIIAGLAGYEAIILLVLGIVLVVAEFFLPGGIAGVAGAVAIVSSLMLSGADTGHMAMSIGIAILVAIVASVILFKYLGLERGFFRHIILQEATTTDKGFVSSVSRLELIGLEGETLTPLRPSGTAVFDDERLDVVSEGRFLQAGQPVKIIKTEGSRIVVRELNKDN